MPNDTDQFDFFVSYSRNDNASGWITRFVEELIAEHARFFASQGRKLNPFFDRDAITPGKDWEIKLLDGIAKSRLFLAFISPNYLASDWCRREWRKWIDTEISKHILTEGIRPVYLVEVPQLIGKSNLSEQDIAREVAKLCGLEAPHDGFVASAAPLVKQLRRRQFQFISDFARPFANEGVEALRKHELQAVLQKLASNLEKHAQLVVAAAESANTVPPYNKKFTGRLDQLLDLRKLLTDDRAGVICGVHGLGGIGKTELAFTYAHAFASAYPGGRFYVPCERKKSLRRAVLKLGEHNEFHAQISDEERKHPDVHFKAILRCLDRRLSTKGHILLVLDNVTSAAFVACEQTDCLTALGPGLHLLFTTRIPPQGGNWLPLGELPEADALALLEKHRPFENAAASSAALRIVKRLGGFTLAIELVGAWLAAKPGASYVSLADGLGLQDLEDIAESGDVALHRHNERRLTAVLGPVLSDLKPAERRMLEYAALLPPDCVALSWLHKLVSQDFPKAMKPTRLIADPWRELWESMLRRALFSRVKDETTEPNTVRMHRLLQELLLRELADVERAARQAAVDKLIKERADALKKTIRWETARWEIEPFAALAGIWADNNHDGASWLLSQAATWLYHLAVYSEAETLIRRALKIDEDSFGPNHTEVATDLNNLAQLLQATNRLAEAETLMRRALTIDEDSFGPNHTEVATDLNNLAQLLQATNRLAEAETLMRRALKIDEDSFGPNHTEVATDLNNLAALLQATNRLAEAETLMRRALKIDEDSFGPDHHNVARGINNLARLLQATNRFAEAEPLLRRALKIDEGSFGPDHPNVARGLNNLAQLLQTTNRLDEAEPHMRRALKIDEDSFGPDHPDVATALHNLALLFLDTNRLDEAEPLMCRALKIFEDSFGPDHPNVATSLNNLARLLLDTNRFDEAEPLLRRALKIDEDSFGPDHPDVARDLNNLAWLLQATNRPDEAEPFMRRNVEIMIKFGNATGHEHPHFKTITQNCIDLLKQTGLSHEQAMAKLQEIMSDMSEGSDANSP